MAHEGGSVLGRARLVVVLVALVAAVCGGCAATDPPGSGGDPSGSASGADPGAFPVTIEGASGPVTVPAAPKRVVTLGFNDADTAVALGVTPVGVREWLYPGQAGGPWLTAKLGGAKPQLLASDSLQFEKIAALAPDLILYVYGTVAASDYAKLSAIAPTVTAPKGSSGIETPRAQQVTQIGKALGRSSRAAALNQQVDASFAKAKAAHPQFAGKSFVLVLPSTGGQVFAYNRTDARMGVALDLGFVSKPAIDQAAGSQFYATLSYEQAGMLAADVLVVFSYQGAEQPFLASPVVKALDVVKSGHLVVLDDDVTRAFGYNTVLSAPYLLDKLVAALGTAVG